MCDSLWLSEGVRVSVGVSVGMRVSVIVNNPLRYVVCCALGMTCQKS